MDIYKYVCDEEPVCKTVHFSDFSNSHVTERDVSLMSVEDQKKFYIFPEGCSGSDSSGKIYHVSNYKVFIRDYLDHEGVYKIDGDQCSYGIAIRYDVYQNNRDITEAINCLECEAILDDQHFIKLEQEWINEAISEAYNDIYSEIDWDEDFDDDPEIENQELVEKWIREAIEYLAIEFTDEYTSYYLNTDEIIPYIKDRLILCRKDLPLYTNWEWSCEYTKKVFLEKLADGSYI
jgi:hypothetical protein